MLWGKSKQSSVSHLSSAAAIMPDLPVDHPFLLHRLVFFNDVDRVRALLHAKYPETVSMKSVGAGGQNGSLSATTRSSYPYLDTLDDRGNTSLHLAIMLGHRQIIELLLNGGANCSLKSALSWSPLQEAISYGDRDIIQMVLTHREAEMKQVFGDRVPRVAKGISEV
jgi:ankyrin repeat protein